MGRLFLPMKKTDIGSVVLPPESQYGNVERISSRVTMTSPRQCHGRDYVYHVAPDCILYGHYDAADKYGAQCY